MTDDEHTAFAEDVRWLALTKAVGRSVLDDLTFSDFDDERSLRQSLVRQRLAAAAERQAHDARAYVVDWSHDPATGKGSIVVATPTGDRREERELLIEAVAAIESERHGATAALCEAMIVAFLFPWLMSND
jgi:hypothetical protein